MTGQPTVLFAGGGSGGHLFPGIAVADALVARNAARPHFLRSGRPIEDTVLATCDYTHSSLPLDFSRAARSPLALLSGYWRSRRHAVDVLMRERPGVVVGLAGRASIPVVHAARRQRIPIVLLEPNIVAGRATWLLARSARTICLSFSETRVRPRAKCVVTGNPVRHAFEESAHRSSYSASSRSLLILGGSQGAQFLNGLMVEVLRDLREDFAAWNIVHQTGPAHVDACRAAYGDFPVRVQSFLDDPSAEMERASLVVSRTGATTLAELACVGRPSVLVPYPRSVGDHQVANARFYERANAARVVLQDAAAVATMRATLKSLVNDETGRITMAEAMRSTARPRAADAVADRIVELLQTST